VTENRIFVDVPGSRTHELPPLLLGKPIVRNRLHDIWEMVEEAVLPIDERAESDSIVVREAKVKEKADLTLNLATAYSAFLTHWTFGDNVFEWIRQCETEFGNRMELRGLIQTNVWPHAGRAIFVTLLNDKAVDTGDVELEKAVGMRLTFRRPPRPKNLSKEFLMSLNNTVALTAYQTWTGMLNSPVSSLPPNRFHFEVLKTFLE